MKQYWALESAYEFHGFFDLLICQRMKDYNNKIESANQKILHKRKIWYNEHL